MEANGTRILLVRSCEFSGPNVVGWEIDELGSNAQIDETLKRDLLGARRKILFVEGTDSSLDKPLYSLIFPMVSVISKGSCRDVENAVTGLSMGEGMHWLQAFGIADGDGYNADQIREKKEKGVYTLPYYSVEAIYFHSEIIRRIALRQAAVSGFDGNNLAGMAIQAGIDSLALDTERLCIKVAKKAVRKAIWDQIPNDDILLSGNPIFIQNDGMAIRAARKTALDTAVEQRDWNAILAGCSVRESRAVSAIVTALGFQKTEHYYAAVRHLLASDADTLHFVRTLFDDLPVRMLT
jgi:hypothetical protein